MNQKSGRAEQRTGGLASAAHQAKERPDASVVIVSWNCKPYLLKCLDVIGRHTKGISIEVIVVDNASSDGTAEAVRELADVRLIETGGNHGFSRGNNIGIVQSSGRYVCLVNPDVEFRGDCLAALCRYMDANKGVGLCGPKIFNPDGTVQYSCREFPTLWNNFCFALGLHRLFPRRRLFSNELMSYFDHNEQREVEALSGCFMVVRRKALEEVGLLDEAFFMYSEDVDWCRRFRQKGWGIVFNPVESAIHYGGASSENVSIRSAVEREKAILRYWVKHHTKLETTLLRGILLLHHALRAMPAALSYMVNSGARRSAVSRLEKNIICMRGSLASESGAGRHAGRSEQTDS